MVDGDASAASASALAFSSVSAFLFASASVSVAILFASASAALLFASASAALLFASASGRVYSLDRYTGVILADGGETDDVGARARMECAVCGAWNQCQRWPRCTRTGWPLHRSGKNATGVTPE